MGFSRPLGQPMARSNLLLQNDVKCSLPATPSSNLAGDPGGAEVLDHEMVESRALDGTVLLDFLR